jgi:glycosyltransferase involved in cell wall biosynthesis
MKQVACYMQPHRGGGVARHAAEIARRLFDRSDVSGTVIVSRRELKKYPQFVSRVPGVPIRSHAVPENLMERSWKLLGWPPFPVPLDGFDVLYSPVEQRFPRCKIPTLMTVHDVQGIEPNLPWSDTPEHRRFRSRWLTWLPGACRTTTRILTVSEFSRRRIVELLQVDPGRISVIGNGVSEAFLQAGLREPQALLALAVVIGGLRTKKGAAATLAVADSLARQRSEFVIEVYGQHEAAWVAEAEKRPNVRLYGSVSDDGLATRLAEASALLFLSPYEGFGLPAIEAMAAGTVPVVADAASLPEVVGDAGIMVDPSDPDRIATILLSLATQSESRLEKVARGRQRAAGFTWEGCVDRLLVSMDKALAS